MAIVRLDNLGKRYGGQAEPSVRGVTLTIADGEFMVLLGPSGCGKSTALRMIAGLEPISSGTVAIDGRIVNDVPAKDRDIAMVFQSYALYPHMTVRQNLAFGLRRRRMAKAEIDRRVASAAERLGLTPFLARKPHALSGGQRQRVALGRAIVRSPKVFLFDEPLSNLDAALRVTTRNELIRQQHELGTTTIYVTHDQVEAMTMGDRICIMNRGETVQIGKPLEVYRAPADTFVARFLGSPAMNLLAATLRRDGAGHRLDLAGTTVPVADCYPPAVLAPFVDRPIIAGIRPEDIYETATQPGCSRPAGVTAGILAVEPLGAETLLMLSLPAQSEECIARVGRDTLRRHGEAATLYLDAAALHLFDPGTTKALPRATAEAAGG
ncbi:MAG: sn-glycerol-3-phosphate ABC transporter ATP-binding protein UgpC [Geminicoccaceae bacterium]